MKERYSAFDEANEIANKAFGDDLERDARYIDSLYRRAEACGCKNCWEEADSENYRKWLEWQKPVEDYDEPQKKIQIYVKKLKNG